VITANYNKIVAGSIAVSALSFLINYLIRLLEKKAEILIRGGGTGFRDHLKGGRISESM
jgi:hypothetical protein